jgi:hypothetical protein
MYATLFYYENGYHNSLEWKDKGPISSVCTDNSIEITSVIYAEFSDAGDTCCGLTKDVNEQSQSACCTALCIEYCKTQADNIYNRIDIVYYHEKFLYCNLYNEGECINIYNATQCTPQHRNTPPQVPLPVPTFCYSQLALE